LRVVWAASVVKGSQAGAQAGISALNYFLAQSLVLCRYAGLLLVPWGFTPDYEIAAMPVWIGASAWVGLVVLAVVLARSMKWANGALWVLIALVLVLPSSSIFPASDLMADRRMYLPMLALSAALGLSLARLPKPGLVLLIAVLCAISMRYSLLWRTPESLWTEAVVLAPTKARPRIQLARSVEPLKGLAILNEAQRLRPEDPNVAAEQGRVLLASGRVDEALAAFGRALALDPSDARSISNRGAALAALGQTDAAVADFTRALAADPCQFDALLNLRRVGRGREVPPGCRYSARQRALLAN
jgi:tetratricopeptide (TPR) repeat protein